MRVCVCVCVRVCVRARVCVCARLLQSCADINVKKQNKRRHNGLHTSAMYYHSNSFVLTRGETLVD